MCGRLSLTASGEELAEGFGLDETPEGAARYNIAPPPPPAPGAPAPAVRGRVARAGCGRGPGPARLDEVGRRAQDRHAPPRHQRAGRGSGDALAVPRRLPGPPVSRPDERLLRVDGRTRGAPSPLLPPARSPPLRVRRALGGLRRSRGPPDRRDPDRPPQRA